jgi:hypothetical protein
MLQILDLAEVDALAAQFAEKIPELEFSPADMLYYLRGYVNDPRRAVIEVEEGMILLRAE